MFTKRIAVIFWLPCLAVLLLAASGNIRWNQLRSGDRHGNGSSGQSSDGTGASGNCAKFDADGNITDSGAACGTGSGGGLCSVNAQTGTSYTLVLADGTTGGSACIGTVTVNNAASNTVTVPPHSSVAFPTPDEIDLVQLGAGQSCFVAGAGVTLTTPTSLCARAQNSTIGIRQTAMNTWIVFGDTQ